MMNTQLIQSFMFTQIIAGTRVYFITNSRVHVGHKETVVTMTTTAVNSVIPEYSIHYCKRHLIHSVTCTQ